MSRSVSLLTVVFLALPGAAKDPVYTGELQKVTQHFITIRLADHRLIDALLPKSPDLQAAALAARFHVGDPVEMAWRIIPAVWMPTEQTYAMTGMTSLRRLHASSAEDLARALSSHAWREPGNLLKLPDGAPPPPLAPSVAHLPAEGLAVLDRARAVSLDYLAHLPGFVVDETARRYSSTLNPPQWRPFDTIQSQITYQGAHEIRDRITRDGVPLKEPLSSINGQHWHQMFSAYLGPIFNPKCPTVFDSFGKGSARGMDLYVFSFKAPPDSCFNAFDIREQRYYAAMSGRVFVDGSDGQVMQLDIRLDDPPDDFPILRQETEVSWDRVKIGDAVHVLPVATDILYQYRPSSFWWVRLEYTNHRQFTAASTIIFN
jgi:hypothetical protein